MPCAIGEAGMARNALYWINRLNLQPHPEGGYFIESYRTETTLGERAASTGIYFLIEAGNVSNFHRIDADEMWHFYAGDALNVHMIAPDGSYSRHEIGSDPERGQVFQAVVPAGYWFGAEVANGGAYALVGCTVAPGFEFSGFELADRANLTSQFPDHAEIIRRLTT